MPRLLLAIDLGRIDYVEALQLQRDLVAQRRQGQGPLDDADLLLFCEHPEVVTYGRKTQLPGRTAADPEGGELARVQAAGVPIQAVERGGAATYHGPGQLVGYPIVRLGEGERDLHRFIRQLEAALVEALAEVHGIQAQGNRADVTGVWVGAKKIASLGIACRGWITSHGFALNLEPDLGRFGLFSPCDLASEVMTSLSAEGASPDRQALIAAIHLACARRLAREPGWRAGLVA